MADVYINIKRAGADWIGTLGYVRFVLPVEPGLVEPGIKTYVQFHW